MGNLDSAGKQGEASPSDKLLSLSVSLSFFLLCVVVVVTVVGGSRLGVIILGGGYFVFCKPFGNPSR